MSFSVCKGRTIIVNRGGRTWTYYARAVMEAHLRRELTTDEVVHHINGDRTDDRIENLQVLTRSEHLKLHHAETCAAKKAKRTHCKHGHLLAEHANAKGHCKACKRAQNKRRRSRAVIHG